jgi:hypothetical protein
MPLRTVLAVTLLFSVVFPIVRAARADIISLRNGGEIRGELLDDAKSKARGEPVTIRTLTGATVAIIRSDVDAVVRRRLIVEEYETRRRALDDTTEAHWDLAEWCRQKSLPKERETHLLRVVELDPEHTQAHRALGHIHNKGKWASRDEVMTSRGFVKYKGKYVLPQELEMILKEERVTDSEKSWFRRVKTLHTWLDSDHPERQSEALAALRSIKEPDAVSALARTFKAVPNEPQRLLYVEILSHIDGERPLQPLILQSLWDESEDVRKAAIRSVRNKDIDKAMPAYLRGLKNGLNLIVNRAGAALGELGNQTAIPNLIDALVTRHTYTLLVPDTATGFGTNGTMTGPGGQPVLPPDVELMLAAGQLPYGVQVQQFSPAPPRMKEIPVEKDEENPAVLDALTSLTGENFGYDEPAWRKWYNAQQNLKRAQTPPRKVKTRS